MTQKDSRSIPERICLLFRNTCSFCMAGGFAGQYSGEALGQGTKYADTDRYEHNIVHVLSAHDCKWQSLSIHDIK